MNTPVEVCQFLALLRDLHPHMSLIGTNGRCWQVSKVLQRVFGGMPYYHRNPGHVVTKIGGHFFDITGVVPGDGAEPMTPEECASAEYWGREYLKYV